MSAQLIQHIRKSVNIQPDDESSILSYFRPLHVSKKQNLLEAGQGCTSHYFVLKGCLRLFFLNEKGTEQTTQFAIENWWLTDYMAFQNQQRTDFTIQAVEPTDVLAIDFQKQEQLLVQFPQMERYFRLIYQRAYAASQLRTKYLYDFSREDLYLHFVKNFPDFTQRVPQYLLASFLGFTPEYLSEIRKKRS